MHVSISITVSVKSTTYDTCISIVYRVKTKHKLKDNLTSFSNKSHYTITIDINYYYDNDKYIVQCIVCQKDSQKQLGTLLISPKRTKMK